MPNYLYILESTLPVTVAASHNGAAIRQLDKQEIVVIEDHFSRIDRVLKIPNNQLAVILPADYLGKDLELAALLSGFVLGLSCRLGAPHIPLYAALDGKDCKHAVQVRDFRSAVVASYAPALDGRNLLQALEIAVAANKKAPDHFSITATRFLRYLEARELRDGLFDLCVALESLIQSNTEIQFRFSVSLPKLLGRKGKAAHETYELFKDLYDFRSKWVHGTPDANASFKRIEKKEPELRVLAQEILLRYSHFLKEKSLKEWKEELLNSVLC